MNLTFCGAARQVTGSMFLLQLEDGYQILIDCGMDLGRQEAYPSGSIFPFEPYGIDLVLLTHAHIDHSGNIPNLIRMGYEGQIICTPATQALTMLLLHDSAGINLKKVKFKAGKKNSRPAPLDPRIYLDQQVDDVEQRFVTLHFNHRFEVKAGLYVTFIPTGHLLGAANILIEAEEKGQPKKILFSGDIGRKNYPLLQDPQRIPQVDYLISEGTYGNREHKEKKDPEEIILSVVHKACVEKRGRLIIPAFSVGRTQSILFTLHKLYLAGKLPPIKIFTDSPMAEQSSRIYERHTSVMNEEARELYKTHSSLFDFDNLYHIDSFQQSKEISSHSEPCIIISSSGMITGGRIQHHIKRNLKNPYATILLIGYSAEGTIGHDLREGKQTIKFKEKEIPVEAEIIVTDIYSGHGDQKDLINFVKTQSASQLKNIFLVHGEYESLIDFKSVLENEGYSKIEIPYKGQTFEL